MRPIATYGVAWSVCLCVCWSRSWILQNGWTDEDVDWRIYSILDGESRSPNGKTQFLGLAGPLKSIASRCCSVRSNKSATNGISATAAADCIAPGWPVSHVFPPWKIHPWYATSRQNSLTACYHQHQRILLESSVVFLWEFLLLWDLSSVDHEARDVSMVSGAL